MQQDIEVTTAQMLSHCPVTASPCLFIEQDELDIRNIVDQLIFALADNPGEPGVRPAVLYGAHYRQGMTDVSYGGKA